MFHCRLRCRTFSYASSSLIDPLRRGSGPLSYRRPAVEMAMRYVHPPRAACTWAHTGSVYTPRTHTDACTHVRLSAPTHTWVGAKAHLCPIAEGVSLIHAHAHINPHTHNTHTPTPRHTASLVGGFRPPGLGPRARQGWEAEFLCPRTRAVSGGVTVGAQHGGRIFRAMRGSGLCIMTNHT